MNAYQVLADDSKSSEGKSECFGHLPEVACEICSSEWFTPRVWYPTVRMVDDKDRTLYSDERTVTLKELKRLRSRLTPRVKGKRMPPGSGIGPVSARLSPYASDFVSCATLRLAAKPVIEKFEREGIVIPHGPSVVSLGRVRSEAYVALELELYPVCSPRTEQQLGIGRCKECGAVLRLQGYDNHLIDTIVREYVLEKCPPRHGLILEDVDEMLLATDSFIRVYRAHKMTGLAFKKVGVWI